VPRSVKQLLEFFRRHPNGCRKSCPIVDFSSHASYDGGTPGWGHPVTDNIVSHYRVLEKLGGGGMGHNE